MPEQNKTETLEHAGDREPTLYGREFLAELLPLSGSEALNRILDHRNPGQVIRKMTRVDFFWLIKKVGENDSLPLLSLASLEQWQYILDMELWRRDRIDLNEMFTWLDRLHKADSERFARWLLSEEGNLPAHFFLFNILQVAIKDSDDFIVPQDSFTFDNLYYIRILDKKHEEEIEQILRTISREDYDCYQALLLGLAGMIPTEVEEEMYRFKSVRLAEDGYLPFEEAVSVYSYQKADLLKKDRSDYKLFVPDDEARALVPVTPINHVNNDDFFTKTLSRITENTVSDRLRIEFAGLCNQIFSADDVRFEGIDVLISISRKAAGYINIGIERVSGGVVETAEQFIRNNPLISLFRVGFGSALELKWKAEKWIKHSWFQGLGLKSDFWGDAWGGVLKGILKNKPLYFSDLKEDNEYRDFENLSEIENCRSIINRLILLDELLEPISFLNPLDKNILKDPLLTFHPFLFNFWARSHLKIEPGISPLSIKQIKELFRLLRIGEKRPPYRMADFKESFIRDLMSYHTKAAPDDAPLLEDSLSILWHEFSEEYARVEVSDLDARFTKFFMIVPNPDT